MLKIATWNIGGGYIYDYSNGKYDRYCLEYFVKHLKTISADIICLQEAHVPTNPIAPTQADIIAKQLEIDFTSIAVCDSCNESHLQSGQLLSVAILSKYKILDETYTRLPNPNLKYNQKDGSVWVSHDKGFLITTIDWSGIPITVSSVHSLPFMAFERDPTEPDFQNIIDAMEHIIISQEQHPSIFAGDLNYPNVKRLLPKVFESEYRLAFEDVITFPPLECQLDYVIVSRDWRVEKSQVTKVLADHYVCTTALQLVE